MCALVNLMENDNASPDQEPSLSIKVYINGPDNARTHLPELAALTFPPLAGHLI
jgi:hypothetical protein